MTDQPRQPDAAFIAAVKPVCEAATEGPWRSRGMGGDSYLLSAAQPGAHKMERVFDMFPLAWPRRYLDMNDMPRTDGTAGMRHDDAQFCALARTALPEALERLAAAGEELETVNAHNVLLGSSRDKAVRHAEAAEAERDELRAEVERLTGLLGQINAERFLDAVGEEVKR